MDNCFRVIIAGGRDFTDYALLEEKMDYFLSRVASPIVVVCGQARGADTLGEQYAKAKNYQIAYYPADWSIGKAAGYIRNKKMAENADALVAFWDGKSRGTKHMIDLAKAKNLKIRVVSYHQNRGVIP